jgi:hypothetical protein
MKRVLLCAKLESPSHPSCSEVSLQSSLAQQLVQHLCLLLVSHWLQLVPSQLQHLAHLDHPDPPALLPLQQQQQQ